MFHIICNDDRIQGWQRIGGESVLADNHQRTSVSDGLQQLRSVHCIRHRFKRHYGERDWMLPKHKKYDEWHDISDRQPNVCTL